MYGFQRHHLPNTKQRGPPAEIRWWVPLRLLLRRDLAFMIADQTEVENGRQNVLSRIVAIDSVDEAQLTGMSGEVGQVLGELQLRISTSERMLDQTGDLAPTVTTRTPAPPLAC